MERILSLKRLSPLEQKRVRELQKKHNCKGYMYYVTEWCLGVGYDVVWTPKRITKKDVLNINKSNTVVITDTDAMLECI